MTCFGRPRTKTPTLEEEYCTTLADFPKSDSRQPGTKLPWRCGMYPTTKEGHSRRPLSSPLLAEGDGDVGEVFRAKYGLSALGANEVRHASRPRRVDVYGCSPRGVSQGRPICIVPSRAAKITLSNDMPSWKSPFPPVPSSHDEPNSTGLSTAVRPVRRKAPPNEGRMFPSRGHRWISSESLDGFVTAVCFEDGVNAAILHRRYSETTSETSLENSSLSCADWAAIGGSAHVSVVRKKLQHCEDRPC